MHTITSFTHRLIFFFSLWFNLQNRSGLIATRQGAKNNLILFFFSPFFFFPLLFCDCFFNGFIHSFLHRWKSICHSPFLFLSLFLPLSLSVSHSLSTWFQALLYIYRTLSSSRFCHFHSHTTTAYDKFLLSAVRSTLRVMVTGYKIIRIIREKNECVYNTSHLPT